ncbi:MAG: dephospho-CoA kinase [Thermoanaerobaculales bacterium]|nr:dephospho-CoA kinase [Thermoanaerobaculales bacterium]
MGLTGGLASGKSTVARLLAERGLPVLDADTVVHDLYRPGAAGTKAVAEIFGPGVLDGHGGVDRSALGGRVLRDPELRLALEQAIHPLVREEIARWLRSLGEVPLAVVEAALLVETGSYRAYDVLVVVACDRSQQLERAVSRGMTEERALALMDAQTALEKKRELADVVVDTSGEPASLEPELTRAWTEVEKLCAARRAARGV